VLLIRKKERNTCSKRIKKECDRTDRFQGINFKKKMELGKKKN